MTILIIRIIVMCIALFLCITRKKADKQVSLYWAFVTLYWAVSCIESIVKMIG